MKILYIIGNGLDIAHHMKTSYQDFFKFYLSVPTDDYDIEAMKKDIDKNKYETWADLEIGLGSYASHCLDKSVFLKCLNDIKVNLKVYLEKESDKISNYSLFSSLEFRRPELLLDPEPKNRYDMYCGHLSNSSYSYIDVITFNYTLTLESLFKYDGSSLVINNNAKLVSLLHVHGTLDNMMVMGVNDSNQISNIGYNTDLDVLEEFVKPEYNDACLNNKNEVCTNLIQNADIIVLYGTSLGLSDSKWWRLIGKRMETDNYPLLVYLPYDKNKNQVAEPNHLRRWTKGYVNEIREKFSIKLDENILASRICIALNKRLFQIKKTPIT